MFVQNLAGFCETLTRDLSADTFTNEDVRSRSVSSVGDSGSSREISLGSIVSYHFALVRTVPCIPTRLRTTASRPPTKDPCATLHRQRYIEPHIVLITHLTNKTQTRQVTLPSETHRSSTRRSTNSSHGYHAQKPPLNPHKALSLNG